MYPNVTLFAGASRVGARAGVCVANRSGVVWVCDVVSSSSSSSLLRVGWMIDDVVAFVVVPS